MNPDSTTVAASLYVAILYVVAWWIASSPPKFDDVPQGLPRMWVVRR